MLLEFVKLVANGIQHIRLIKIQQHGVAKNNVQIILQLDMLMIFQKVVNYNV